MGSPDESRFLFDDVEDFCDGAGVAAVDGTGDGLGDAGGCELPLSGGVGGFLEATC